MKLYIDSAYKEEVKDAYSTGAISGMTTNPSLIQKMLNALSQKGEDVNLEDYIADILQIAGGTPVSLEVTALDKDGIVQQGINIIETFGSFGKVYVKVPISISRENKPNWEALQAIKILSGEDIPVNCTLVLTPEQALLAARAGAVCVSPFVGRIDDLLKRGVTNDNGIKSGVHLIETIVKIFRTHNIKCKVLAASIRSIEHVRECALAGADIATIPYSVLEKMVLHKKTAEGMRKFIEDTAKAYETLIS